MTVFATPIQETVFNLLTADLNSANVFDSTPNLPAGMPFDQFPYVTVGEDQFLPWDTDDRRGASSTIYLHIWSRYKGKKQAKAIMGDIDNLLNRQAGTFTSAGYTFVDCLLEFAHVMDETDGETIHAVLRYRITIQKD